MDKEIKVEVEPASGRKDPGWIYARLLNEKDTSTLICIFCDKVTKGGICFLPCIFCDKVTKDARRHF